MDPKHNNETIGPPMELAFGISPIWRKDGVDNMKTTRSFITVETKINNNRDHCMAVCSKQTNKCEKNAVFRQSAGRAVLSLVVHGNLFVVRSGLLSLNICRAWIH